MRRRPHADFGGADSSKFSALQAQFRDSSPVRTENSIRIDLVTESLRSDLNFSTYNA